MDLMISTPPHDQIHDGTRKAIDRILADLRAATELKAAEASLSALADLFELPWACWVPDTSHPYRLPEMEAYARERGWPDELLDLWWSRHLALKMPFYIRCRFEHLPFVVSLDRKRHRNPSRMSSEEAQATAILRDMGIRAMLVLPLHLSKGRVAMVVWAGARRATGLLEAFADYEGDLLAAGYYFMRIADRSLGGASSSWDERSRLTPREWDCARTLAQGYREAEIAELIGIKKVTVRFHLDNIVQKFGCKTRTQAVALLAQLGLLGPIGT
ncbi:Autoinducer binding domain-containing protein [Rhizobiales bacterium GAS191]|nr:Autoinducer binding domain-containing protein [Rhizobiales bacterium GAS191]